MRPHLGRSRPALGCTPFAQPFRMACRQGWPLACYRVSVCSIAWGKTSCGPAPIPACSTSRRRAVSPTFSPFQRPPCPARSQLVKKLNGVTIEAMKAPAVRTKLEGLGAVFVAEDRTKPEYLGKFVRSEIEKWAKPIKASGVSAD